MLVKLLQITPFANFDSDTADISQKYLQADVSRRISLQNALTQSRRELIAVSHEWNVLWILQGQYETNSMCTFRS